MHSVKWFYWQEKNLFIHIYLQPRASRDEVVGLHGDHLKIRITAPPVDNQANQHLIKFLATTFSVTQKQVVIEKGHTGRIKLIKIDSPKNIGILNEDRFRK